MRRFILAVVIIVVAATIGTIYMGSRSFDGVVVERPYETGLAWDELQKQQVRLGWRIVIEQPEVMKGENQIVVRLTDRNRIPLDDAIVELALSRPSTRAYDRSSRAGSLGGGRYRASLDVPLIGIWDLRTTVSRSADRYVSVDRITAGERDR